jgi:hypothetical protein
VARQDDAAVAQQQLVAAGQQLGVDAYHVKRSVEPVRAADVADEERISIRRCRRGRACCP